MQTLMKNFMESIPKSLIEAAKIDGAGSFRTFCRLTRMITERQVLQGTTCGLPKSGWAPVGEDSEIVFGFAPLSTC